MIQSKYAKSRMKKKSPQSCACFPLCDGTHYELYGISIPFCSPCFEFLPREMQRSIMDECRVAGDHDGDAPTFKSIERAVLINLGLIPPSRMIAVYRGVVKMAPIGLTWERLGMSPECCFSARHEFALESSRRESSLLARYESERGFFRG